MQVSSEQFAELSVTLLETSCKLSLLLLYIYACKTVIFFITSVCGSLGCHYDVIQICYALLCYYCMCLEPFCNSIKLLLIRIFVVCFFILLTAVNNEHWNI